MSYLLVSFHVKSIGVAGLSETQSYKLSDRNPPEAFALNTCNRNEYLFYLGEQLTHQEWLNHLEVSGWPIEKACLKTDLPEIINYLLGVSLSKDSVVFGESEILGQFKRAYVSALEQNRISSILSPLLNLIVRDAKKIRAELGLTQIHTSVATIAGAEIVKRFKNVSPRILFVGAGETNRTVAAFLKKRGKTDFVWSSRGHQRALQAAEEFGGEVLNWDLVAKGSLPETAVIVAATHAKEILVDEIGLLNSQTRYVCDLSVPSNIEAASCEKLGIPYYGIDQMNSELSKSSEQEQMLRRLLDEKIMASAQGLVQELKLRSTKSRLSRAIEDANFTWNKELENLFSDQNLALSTKQKEAIERWSRKLVNKLNHNHLESLKQDV